MGGIAKMNKSSKIFFLLVMCPKWKTNPLKTFKILSHPKRHTLQSRMRWYASICMWDIKGKFTSHNCNFCWFFFCTPYGSYLRCLHFVWLAPTVFALRIVCTYCVCTLYGSHLLLWSLTYYGV